MSTVFADRNALIDLRGALIRFASHVTDEFPAIDAAIERAFDALAQAERYWRSQIVRQVAGLALQLPDLFAATELGVDVWQAESHLDAVAEAAQVSPAPVIFAAIRTLTGFMPFVSGMTQGYGLLAATQRLAEIEQMRRRLEMEMDTYRPALHRFRHILENDLSYAVAYLDRRITTLEAYLLTRLSETALSVGAAGRLELMAGVIGAMQIVAGRANALKGRMAEEIASIVLSQRFGLEEIPFTQPHHGFDRVFRAPGLPLIVVEAKFSADGMLRLGQSESGEQGSLEWVAATAERMAKPATAQWSPANQRIAELVHQLGTENVPVLAVVIDGVRQTAAIYARNDDEWTLIVGDIDLTALM
jgi:hypothetical protein